MEYTDGVTDITPVVLRCYTLTHSDETGDLFLTIGTQFAWHKLNSMRDEVLGEWKYDGSSLSFFVYVYIDQGDFNQEVAAKRNEIFRRELPLALTAIRNGDRFLFHTFPILDQAPIIIHFMSVYPLFRRQENWGTFKSFI